LLKRLMTPFFCSWPQPPAQKQPDRQIKAIPTAMPSAVGILLHVGACERIDGNVEFVVIRRRTARTMIWDVDPFKGYDPGRYILKGKLLLSLGIHCKVAVISEEDELG